MDGESSTTKIDKLNYSNYHFWKIRVQHVLTLKDLEHFLDEDSPQETEAGPPSRICLNVTLC